MLQNSEQSMQTFGTPGWDLKDPGEEEQSALATSQNFTDIHSSNCI